MNSTDSSSSFSSSSSDGARKKECTDTNTFTVIKVNDEWKRFEIQFSSNTALIRNE